MRKTAMMLFQTMFAVSAVVLVSPVSAQIQITANDILGLKGSMQVSQLDTSIAGVMVDVGTPGAGRSWNFDSIALANPIEGTFEFLDPQGTPYAANFPQANLVQKATYTQDGQSFTTYIYLDIQANRARSIGSGASFMGFTNIDSSVSTFSTLPIVFGATWTETEVDRFADPTGTIVSIDSSVSSNTVDGWGTARAGGRDIQCLRLCSTDTMYFIQTIAGNIFRQDTTTTISYIWLAKSDFMVASANSRDGETDPNFNTADGFMRLKGMGTAVADGPDSGSLPATFALGQNYPNPFNPSTRIQYQTESAGQVEIAIFDLRGVQVRTLVSAEQSAGSHDVVWDATNDHGDRVASGRYVYQLKFGDRIVSKMMVLVK